MTTNKIKFSNNWNNKLENDIFTTIRKYNSKRFLYYKENRLNKFEVMLNNKSYGYVFLIDVQTLIFEEIPRGLLMTDTGQPSLLGAKSIFQDFYGLGINIDDFIILTFAKQKNGNRK